MTNEFQFRPPSKLRTIGIHMKAILDAVRGKGTQLPISPGAVRDPFLTEKEQKAVNQGKIQDPEWD